MKVYFAADHAGFELKRSLMVFAEAALGCEVEDCGAFALQPGDDYPAIIAAAARKLAADSAAGIESRAILLGASGEGEAMAANRFTGVRCAVYYGPPSPKASDGQELASRAQKDASGAELDILASTRAHNDANALALGARFVSEDEAKAAVREWLTTEFSGDERHRRRIESLDALA